MPHLRTKVTCEGREAQNLPGGKCFPLSKASIPLFSPEQLLLPPGFGAASLGVSWPGAVLPFEQPARDGAREQLWERSLSLA